MRDRNPKTARKLKTPKPLYHMTFNVNGIRYSSFFVDFTQVAVFVITQPSKSPHSSAGFVVKWHFSFPNPRNRRLTAKRSLKIAVFVVTRTFEIATFVVAVFVVKDSSSHSSSHKPPKSGPTVQGLGFRASGGSGFRIQGLKFRVQGLGFRVKGS